MNETKKKSLEVGISLRSKLKCMKVANVKKKGTILTCIFGDIFMKEKEPQMKKNQSD